jgi:hypothetical protein
MVEDYHAAARIVSMEELERVKRDDGEVSWGLWRLSLIDAWLRVRIPQRSTAP